MRENDADRQPVLARRTGSDSLGDIRIRKEFNITSTNNLISAANEFVIFSQSTELSLLIPMPDLQSIHTPSKWGKMIRSSADLEGL
jgi:hypothetical protein